MKDPPTAPVEPPIAPRGLRSVHRAGIRRRFLHRLSAALATLVLGACAVVPPPMDDLPPPIGREPIGGAPSAPDLSAPVRLGALIPVLLARNPAIATARARLDAAAQRRPQVVALPDPEIEATWFARNAMAPDSSLTRWELMLKQTFPMPQMLSLRGDAADAGTKVAALRYEAAVRDAVATLDDLHAERRYLAAAEAVQSRLHATYVRYADVARAGMNDGAARLPESFRADALAAQAEYDLRLLGEMRVVEDAKLRALLALPPGAAIGPPADAAPVLVLDTPTEALVDRALAWNQELRAAGAEVEMATIDARMARWEYAPMFMVGVGRMFNDDIVETSATGGGGHAAAKAGGMPSSERGRDSTTLSFGMTLPIWRPKLEAGVREADAKLRAMRAEEHGMRAMLAADVAMAAFQARTTQRLADLYAKTLVPQAELAMTAADARVRAGEESLASSLELAATWQQMSIARLRAETDHARAIAALERILGTTATATAPDDAVEAPR